MRTGKLTICLVLMVLMFVAVVEGVVITSFEELMGPAGQTLQMPLGSNLMIDFGAGPVSIVDAGLNEGSWHLGLLDAQGFVIGWAKNSAKQVPNWYGRLIGEYSSLLGVGNYPTNAVLVYDNLINGWTVSGGVVGSFTDLAEGDLFFWTTEIKFDGILGNMTAFSPYMGDGSTARIPDIIVMIPEPATVALLGLGFIGLRRRKTQ